MNVHRLDGCAPTPLASYLKALGVLRIVGEQLDPEVRAWWEGERFVLASRCSRSVIVDFVRDKYAPTPLVNPWGARSGFYGGSSERTSRELLGQISSATNPRFNSFHAAIKETKAILDAVTGGRKPADTEKALRADLILALKAGLRGSTQGWLETVLAFVGSAERPIQQPAVFGTGGSEGSGSYTAAFMKAIEACLLRKEWSHAIEPSLFGRSAVPDQLWDGAFGQFLPDGNGSPWDLLLAFEGACIVRSGVANRSDVSGDRWLCSPFFVAPVSAGFGSASRSDEYFLNKGAEYPGRGEQWFPLWTRPATLSGISALFRQGRSAVGRNRARDGGSLARGIYLLGRSQGVGEFVRYGYLQRNNQATHFAVPLGRFVVPLQPTPAVNCLDDLDRNSWLPRLRREARAKNAPNALVRAERQLADALFAVVQQPDLAARWQAVLLRLGDVEAVQRRGSGFEAGPIPTLRPDWVRVADDGSAEFRLALACALQGGERRSDGSVIDGVRRHWITLDKGRFKTSGDVGQHRLVNGTDRVFGGRRAIDDLASLVERRLIEGTKDGGRRIPLAAANVATSAPADIGQLLRGELDVARIGALLPALMAVDARRWSATPVRLPASAGEGPDDAWIAIRLALSTQPLADGRTIGADPAILRRLICGDAPEAVRVALRRLRAAGVVATIRAGGVPPDAARLWAAALAFPISRTVAAQLQRRLDPNSLQENAL